MLFVTRLITSIAMFVVLLVIFFIGTLAIMGGVAGARAAKKANATDFQSGYEAGQVAGQELGRKYGRVILLGSFGAAAITSLGLSFSGVLPWCRPKPTETPPVPPA